MLGVDIGGTKIAVAVVEAAADLAARVLSAYPAAAAGVGAPGVAAPGITAAYQRATGELGVDAGVIGAAELARELVSSSYAAAGAQP